MAAPVRQCVSKEPPEGFMNLSLAFDHLTYPLYALFCSCRSVRFLLSYELIMRLYMLLFVDSSQHSSEPRAPQVVQSPRHQATNMPSSISSCFLLLSLVLRKGKERRTYRGSNGSVHIIREDTTHKCPGWAGHDAENQESGSGPRAREKGDNRIDCAWKHVITLTGVD
jgi:hypothetical protein